MKIKKLVLPVAGLGKRLRPLTLITPKNLVPLQGRPLIEYALEEAVRAEIEEAIIVTSPDHISHYEAYLAEAKQRFPELTFRLRVQEKPLGDGHAVLQAADLIGDEPFAVRFCDDVIVDDSPTFERLVKLFNQYEKPVIFLERVPMDQVSRYGVVGAEPTRNDSSVYRISTFVEKPKVEEAPSNLIVIGGYVLTREVLDRLIALSKVMPDQNDALRIADALTAELKEGKEMYGWAFPGKRLDCGTLEGLKFAEEFMATRKLQMLAVE